MKTLVLSLGIVAVIAAPTLAQRTLIVDFGPAKMSPSPLPQTTQFVTIDGNGTDQNYTHTGTTRMAIQGVVNIIANASLSLLERAAAEADVAGAG